MNIKIGKQVNAEQLILELVQKIPALNGKIRIIVQDGEQYLKSVSDLDEAKLKQEIEAVIASHSSSRATKKDIEVPGIEDLHNFFKLLFAEMGNRDSLAKTEIYKHLENIDSIRKDETEKNKIELMAKIETESHRLEAIINEAVSKSNDLCQKNMSEIEKVKRFIEALKELMTK